jgi:phage tail-like protein
MPAAVDPLASYTFYVEIDGITEASFKECLGLESKTEIIEHRESTKNGTQVIKKLPGALTWANITLRRGVTDSLILYEWRKKVEEGKINEARKNGSIVVFNTEQTEVARFNFINGWPCRYKGPDIVAAENKVAIEEIEIVHEGLTREK